MGRMAPIQDAIKLASYILFKAEEKEVTIVNQQHLQLLTYYTNAICLVSYGKTLIGDEPFIKDLKQGPRLNSIRESYATLEPDKLLLSNFERALLNPILELLLEMHPSDLYYESQQEDQLKESEWRAGLYEDDITRGYYSVPSHQFWKAPMAQEFAGSRSYSPLPSDINMNPKELTALLGIWFGARAELNLHYKDHYIYTFLDHPVYAIVKLGRRKCTLYLGSSSSKRAQKYLDIIHRHTVKSPVRCSMYGDPKDLKGLKVNARKYTSIEDLKAEIDPILMFID